VDLVADADPGVAAAQNRLERLRDPSHTRMLAASEVEALLGDAGLESIDVAVRPLERPLEVWLEQARTDEAVREEIRTELRADVDGEAVTGFRPRPGADGELWFTQTFASAIATRLS
jgi:hypothetical protein